MPYRRSSAPRASARAAASSNSLPPASATRRLELEEITPLSVAAYVEQLGTAAEDRGAAVAGGIGRVQSAADFDDDVVAEGNVSAQSIGKMIFPAVAGPQDVSLRRRKHRGPKPARGRPFGLQTELKSEGKTEILVKTIP